MREILFKAKTEDGKWIEGDLIHYESGEVAILEKFSKYGYEATEICRRTKVQVDTVCQYTGLKDKNGKKIWENDIVFDDELCSLVIWDELSARFVVVDYGTKGCLMEYGFDEYAGEYGVVDTNGFDDFCDDANVIFEVIGNRFDNPELLERGD